MTDNNNSGVIINISLTAARVEDTMAKAYRLGRRNGKLVLQGCFQWTQGSDYGHEWRDIPIVDLDAAAERLTVQEISDLPQHRENYIAEHRDGEIQLDGDFSRANLQQLADSIPDTRD